MTYPPNALIHSRRTLLAAGLAVGATASFFGANAVAAGPRKRFVLIICRGAADGLSIAPPVGDPHYAGMRRQLAITDAALPLDGDFGLHPALTSVHRLALTGQARLAPAVAMPRRVRSHFEAQDQLENGAADLGVSGWMNRALAAASGDRRLAGLSVGPVAPLVLQGETPTASWSPGRMVETKARLPTLIQDLYKDDPTLGQAFAKGLEIEAAAQATISRLATPDPEAPAPLTRRAAKQQTRAMTGQGADAARALGRTSAGLILDGAGADMVAISLDGFDTHANQAGQLATRLTYLDALVDGLHSGLGQAWADTAVLVVTEFGRTARINGTAGTDHGTASTALLLGGGLKRGGIIGDWPTLQEAKLYENRDLAPTLDLRSLFKGVLADHMGVDRRALDTTVFPDSANAPPLQTLV
ncbi:MAG: DUF1501 domain-containing protein [Phenylobacterium sp.]|uniref:DUF1501 domain-containing protein n=1 Tax=Phenylobacterium sp. TaxID=1871053 RepID=UPI00391DAF5F